MGLYLKIKRNIRLAGVVQLFRLNPEDYAFFWHTFQVQGVGILSAAYDKRVYALCLRKLTLNLQPVLHVL